VIGQSHIIKQLEPVFACHPGIDNAHKKWLFMVYFVLKWHFAR
jgi:hypothetical protein